MFAKICCEVIEDFKTAKIAFLCNKIQISHRCVTFMTVTKNNFVVKCGPKSDVNCTYFIIKQEKNIYFSILFFFVILLEF